MVTIGGFCIIDENLLNSYAMKNPLFIFLLLLMTSLSSYGGDDVMKGMEKMSNQLKVANKDITRGDFNETDLENWTKLTIKMKSAAALCSSKNEAALLNLKSKVDGLGEKLDSEDSEVTKKRKA